MKKLTRRSFTAAGILSALSAGLTSLTGCDFDLVSCTPAALYGPPPEYDPDDNEIETVYGPPEDFGLDEDGSVDEGADYDPEENEPVMVYGPPEYFEGDTDAQEDEEYDPEDNMMQIMYGPMEPYDPDDAD